MASTLDSLLNPFYTHPGPVEEARICAQLCTAKQAAKRGHRWCLTLTWLRFISRIPRTNISKGWLQSKTKHDPISSRSRANFFSSPRQKKISAESRPYKGKFHFMQSATAQHLMHYACSQTSQPTSLRVNRAQECETTIKDPLKHKSMHKGLGDCAMGPHRKPTTWGHPTRTWRSV